MLASGDSRIEDDSASDEGPWTRGIEQALAQFTVALAFAIEGDSSSDRAPQDQAGPEVQLRMYDSSEIEPGWRSRL